MKVMLLVLVVSGCAPPCLDSAVLLSPGNFEAVSASCNTRTTTMTVTETPGGVLVRCVCPAAADPAVIR